MPKPEPTYTIETHRIRDPRARAMGETVRVLRVQLTPGENVVYDPEQLIGPLVRLEDIADPTVDVGLDQLHEERMAAVETFDSTVEPEVLYALLRYRAARLAAAWLEVDGPSGRRVRLYDLAHGAHTEDVAIERMIKRRNADPATWEAETSELVQLGVTVYELRRAAWAVFASE